MNYCNYLFDIKKEWLNNTALVDIESEKSFTYAELQNSVIALSKGFVNRGIKSGDVVALHIANSAEVVISHLAVQYIGGVTCLLDPLIPIKALTYYLDDTKAKHLITGKKKESMNEICDGLDNILEANEIFPIIDSNSNDNHLIKYEYLKDEISTIFYTSGTTSKPKGVMLSPKNFSNHVKIFIKGCYDYSASDKLLCFVPFSHGYGSKSVFLPCLQSGASMYIMRSFHPHKVIEAIEKYKITHLFGVPSHYQQLLKKEELYEYLKKLKGAFTAAALLRTDTAQEWNEKLGYFLDEGYGLIETSTGVAFRKNRLPNKLGDIGTYPKEFVEIEVVNEKFEFLKANERGEIVIKSESVMLGYINKKEETKKAIYNGWFRTGDMGYKTNDDQIVLTGRIKDVINIAGIKVAPFEIEAALNELPGINESAVIGVDDEMYGEIVIAFVKLNNGLELREREIIKYLQSHLMNFQIPKEVHFIDQFPRNTMGKIDKNTLKNGLKRV